MRQHARFRAAMMASRQAHARSQAAAKLCAVIDRLPRTVLCDLIETMIARLDHLEGDCDLEPEDDIDWEDRGGAL